MAQVSFGRVAAHRSSRSLAFTLRLGVLLRSCRPKALYILWVFLMLIRQPSRCNSTCTRR